MPFLTGTHTTKATWIDFVGIVAGIAAPISLLLFDVYANSQLTGIVWSNLTITALIHASNEVVQGRFLLYNLAVSALIALFAIAVFRRLTVGSVAITLLAIASAGTIGIALTCGDLCEAAIPSEVQDVLHTTVALTLIATMIALPRVAARKLRRTNKDDWMYRWSNVAASLVALTALHLGVSLLQPNFGFWLVGDLGFAERLLWYAGYSWVVLASVAMWRERDGRRPIPFDVRNLQEGVAYGSRNHTAGIFLAGRIEDGGRYRTAMRTAIAQGVIRPQQMPGAGEGRSALVTHGLTRRALAKLNMPYHWNAVISDAFGMGAIARAAGNGDLGDNGPAHWDDWAEDADACFWIQADDADAAQRQAAEVTDVFTNEKAGRALTILTEIATTRGPVGDGFLGFADGISNPWIERVHDSEDHQRRGGGKLTKKGWDQVALGEFFLGELDESRDVFPMPDPIGFFRHGTFMVARHYLERHLDQSEQVNLDYRRLIGRDRSGTPVAPNREVLDLNTFTYGEDPEGFGCPVAAHVRRANPRDALGFDGIPSHHRRIIRRGMEIHGDSGAPNGLMFIAYNARIADQFEFIQRLWLNDGHAFGSGTDPDPVAGMWGTDESRSVIVHADEPTVVTLKRPAFHLKGAGYFFVPSFLALRDL